MKNWPMIKIPYFTNSMMSKMFDPSFDDPFKNMFANFFTNVLETEDKISYSIDLPGVKQNDLEVLQEDRTISVKAQRKDKSGAEQYSSSFTADNRCLIETLDAHLEDGVLTISFNKRKPDANAKKVEVKIRSNK